MQSPSAGGNLPAAAIFPHANLAALSGLHSALAALHVALDKAEGLSPMERLRLLKELGNIRKELGAGPGALQKLRLSKRLGEVRSRLEGVAAGRPLEPIDTSEQVAQGLLKRQSTSQFYDYDPNRKPAQRKRENAEAMALLRQLDAGQIKAKDLTEAQRAALAKYSGTGGNLVGADGKKGSAYEYYTPKPIAEGVWNLLTEMGFGGGLTLDPSAGVGIFGATAPVNAAVDAIELNETSGRVNQVVNDGPGYRTTIAPFEQVAAATPDESYDAVVTNVPFGGVADRGGNQFKDTKYRDEPLQNYFILRSLEKLRPGGLAAFITPPRCVSGKGGKEEDLRVRCSYMAEFMGAYRLPNSVFGTAAADTMTDVIVFRKFSRPVLDKIAELRQQNPGLLAEANVVWREFIEGNYFKGEGVRFILGTMARAKGQFGEKDVLQSDLGMAEIGRLLRKFPGSRIDWPKLDAVETSPIAYREGDTMRHAGETLQMTDGRWVVIKPAGSDEAAAEMAEALAKLTTPLGAVNSDTSYSLAVRTQTAMVESGQALIVPDWMRGLLTQLLRVDVEQRESVWKAATVGLAIDQVMLEHQGEEVGFNYLEGYPALSEAMARCAHDAGSPPAALATNVKTAMKKVRNFYSKAGGYTGVWRGDVVVTQDTRTEAQKFEAARYAAGGGSFVALEDAKRVFGDAFDPMGTDDWCLSADGKSVSKADDYYVGNYADFLARIDKDLAEATDDSVKEKLLRQKLAAEARLLRTDPAQMTFTLFSPFVTMEERAEFLRRFVDPRFMVAFDEKTGQAEIDIGLIGGPKNTRDKLLKRLALYMNGTRLSLGGAEVGDQKAAIKALRGMAQQAEAQFNSWVKSNQVIMGRLHDVANDPQRIYFRQVEDESPLDIPGLNPDWKLHGYQNAEVRKKGREFSGINGFGVGLGKAQDVNEPVLTPDGWRRMGDIKAGDFVIAADGTPTEVLGVYPQGMKPSFEITFHDGAKARSCDEHLWFTSTEADRRRRLYSMSKGGSDALAGSVKTLRDIMGTLRRGEKQKNHSIPMVRPVQFPEQALSIHPYLMGVLLGDGSMPSKGTPNYSKPDEWMRDRVCSLVAGGFGLEIFERGGLTGSCPTYRLGSGHDNPIKAALTGMGLTGTQSHQRFIPDSYMRGSVSQRIELLRGLMDTDGYVSKDGITVQFTSTSYLLATQVRELALTLGASAWITNKIPTFTYRGETRTGREAFTVGLRMPPDINPFAMPRKAGRVKAKSKYLPTRLIDKVEYVGEVESQCIAIAHESHLYVTRDCVVTHNTATALVTVQHAQSIGVKTRTMFVVPNSVLSNWRKESGRVYANTDDCLYVGLKVAKDGSFKTDPGQYDADLTRVLEGRHSKVFVTYEAFQRLRLKADTAAAYDAYLASVDRTYADSDLNKKSEKSKSLRQAVIEQLTSDASKSLAAPYFEDLGIDSLVIDEAHMLKNSRGTVEFKGGKFLSLAEPSSRGLDAQAKAWFVRKDTPRKDGVILLTATPITNSPLEIYSMLSLAVGDQKLNDMMVGVKGADQFMEVMCTLENRDEETLDGQVKPYDVFVGLSNVDLLRNALAATSTIKEASDVGAQIVMPAAEEKPTSIPLPTKVVDLLKEYKGAFRFAIDELSERATNRGDPKAYERIAEKFGEPMELIAHPFNLINKMSMLIADPELDERATFYVISPASADKAADVCGAWNAKAPIEDRPRMGPHTDQVAMVGTKTKKDGDDQIELLRIQVRAKVVGDRIILDTMDSQQQTAFEKLAEAKGLDLDVTVPPKLAALLVNFQHEEAHPRGKVSGLASGRVRQLIFCDVLALHNKIKRLLMKRCGIPAGSIAIITGTVNGKPEEIMDVQDGFNAEGDDNKYRVVIANEKAEVGINLQKGTQAIHHMTLGWTPDSLTQRNGRGVRQGNETSSVRVYHYDADGTFDSYKRMLVGKKSTWIEAVMDTNGGNEVQVSGGLTREQMESLIDTVGDTDAMGRQQERAAAQDRLARETSTRGKQTIQVATIKAQREWLKKYSTPLAWAGDKVAAYVVVREQIAKVQDRLSNPKATASAVLKNQEALAILKAREDGLRRLIGESVTIKDKDARYGPSEVDIDAFVKASTNYVRRGETRADTVYERFTQSWGYEITVAEDGPIGNEWRAEVDAATAMVEAAKQDFTRMAGQDGGYSPAVLAKVDSDEAIVLDGKLVCAGAFIEGPEGLAVVFKQNAGMVARYVKPDGKTAKYTLADAIRKATTILPGSAGYDAAVTAAAEIEDQIAEIGALPAESIDRLFSAVVPEVAQRRKRSMLVQYSSNQYRLPAPHFPIVVTAGDGDDAPLVKAIAARQSAVVKSIVDNGSGYHHGFVCDSDVPVVKADQHASFSWAVVRDVAKAYGARLTAGDFAVFNKNQYSTALVALINPARANFRATVIEGATTVEDLRARLERWLQDEAFPQYAIADEPKFKTDIVSLLRQVSYGESAEYQRAVAAIEAQIAKAAAGEAGPVEAPAPVAPMPAEEPANEDPNRVVGVTGDTRRWKDQIKSAASMVGGRAIWDGNAECWNVPFKAWERLVRDYPACEQGLKIVESSGKLSYGRRRY